MCTDVMEQRNVALDQILAERRSYRIFTQEMPPDDAIRRILHAGLLAPFAAAATGPSKDYFRRFFVIRGGSKTIRTVIPLVMKQVKTMSGDLKNGMEKDPGLRERAGRFFDRLQAMERAGFVPGIGTAPFYIIVAERRGFPPVGPLSLAHCMENMWLKATALELGFQLVSITSQMSDDPEFCKILGITPGEWDLMGCAVGYPADELSPSIRPPVEDLTRWLD